jgi:hypothetical protein
MTEEDIEQLDRDLQAAAEARNADNGVGADPGTSNGEKWTTPSRRQRRQALRPNFKIMDRKTKFACSFLCRKWLVVSLKNA